MNLKSYFVISDKSLTAIDIKNGAFVFKISNSSGLNKIVVSSIIRLERILIPIFSKSCVVFTSVLYIVIIASCSNITSSIDMSNFST